MTSLRKLLGGCVLLTGLLLHPHVGAAASNQVAIRYFPDVTISLGGQTFHDENVVEELRPAGSVAPVGIGSIPRSAAITAYHVRAGGTQVLSFDTPVALPGGLVAMPGDVVQTNADGTAPYTMVFDASANGVPPGVGVDAVSFTAKVGGDLLLSFDTEVTLPGSIVAADEDVVRLTGSTFTLFFDGSAAGVPAALDLDGVNYVPGNGHFLVSFDTGGTVGGVTFGKEDVLEYTPSGSTWQMAYDASAAHPGWPAADLGAADVLTDLDLDGVADEYETNTGIYVSPYDTGTSPADLDTDNDGLTDGVETHTGVFVSAQNTGTDPLDPDSDGDAFTDGTEVGNGSNPNDPLSTPASSVPALGPLGLGALMLSLLAAGHRALRRR